MAQADVVPVQQPQRIGKLGDPCAMVIFGAAGDLTRRKLIPALYNLAKGELLSREFAVVGVARTQMSTEDFRKQASEDIKEFATEKVDADVWEWFVRRMYYVSGDFGDKTLYPQLKDFLDKVDTDHSTHGNHLYYMATSADFFEIGRAHV
jgi:glucose-6-phosphate 1-dehydrogenase